MRATFLILLTPLIACGPQRPEGGGAACGIAAVAGPAMVLSEFDRAEATLTAPPATIPPRAVARFVAGPAASAMLGRRGDSLEVGIDGGVPAGSGVGFGVLMTDRAGAVRGVLVYDGVPVSGAPVLGNLTVGAARVPLLGIALDSARVEDPRCPFFPDSVLQ
jgi:hypothetical protein